MSPTALDKCKFVVDPDVVVCDLGDGGVLLDLRTSQYYSLNPVGQLVWRTASEPRSVSDLCEKVLSEFDVEPDACADDVRALLDTMCDARLLKKVDV